MRAMPLVHASHGDSPAEPRYVLFDAYVESSTSFYRILQDSELGLGECSGLSSRSNFKKYY